ncbi:MAG TPA: F0F1 ATP synthase subunit A, partial [Planctomycetaceae bacterium]|nr:F0F1 ATP synthase subunit A [Planctomycetaceae bacterium]
GHQDELDRHPAGEVAGHPADKYLPFIWSCFFYILICNILGAIPFLGSATGNINVTAVLALTAFGATFLYGAQRMGPVGFWGALVPTIDAPGGLKLFLIPMMFVIEVVGLFIKHSVLAVRLFANIMGGHTVLGVILGFIAMSSSSGMWWLVTPSSILGQVGVGLLELLVAFIQAYVFAFLATIFIGMALHPH